MILERPLSPETELIPYKPAGLPPAPWLVLAPHPDDETFGLGGTIVLATKASLPVKLVVVTDGQLGGESSLRFKETLAAAKVLGISELEFWEIPDRKVQENRQIFRQKLKKILAPFKTVFSPSLFEFHPDHRATTLLAAALLEEEGWPGELWLYEIARQGEANRLVDITPVIETKKQAMKCYQSQLAQNAYFEVVLGLNRARSYTLAPAGVQYAEAFFASKALSLLEAWFAQLKRYF